MGARPWSSPQNAGELLALLDKAEPMPDNGQPQFAFQSCSTEPEKSKVPLISSPSETASYACSPGNVLEHEPPSGGRQSSEVAQTLTDQKPGLQPAEALIRFVREILVHLLQTPKSEGEIASTLQVSSAQLRVWLQKFVDEELIEKRLKPSRYVVQQKKLL
jgi:hypothetical protein